ncbi:DegT/DnrJ/EryC1/StrS family aminotransferase [Antarcticibacterium flavum]|uniref:DegT/DnrJ/EryC1/StrS family aminotransferase n=1 Tax=Antarcticibacterium flavum TaxID=2058175 RepID=A0A5B7X076_9FLAO|nr:MULTISPECIES: DegT/DnrJ/EryC1/StrS family aminotransferase [Antarcticibacterium]MCM4158790.1 aminotransferase DegT [Antarcticibacterium sp. W02-3]QCY68640.1 DegT/DnrJ/EryC1/StrS family aminotransferase [Antarcticibacterium flavum]
MIPVTRTFLPPIEEYHKYLYRIWSSNQIANGGELWKELKERIQEYLRSNDLILTANGTLPLQIALKNLAANGEVITTPFSYVASTAAIVWENCIPVFVDIHPEYLTIDETKIEAAITKRTTAILATHVFGNSCNVEAIETIAQKYGLKVIYDAAHCFGVNYNGQSIFTWGDVSTCSFHATKIFHTGEGGAMFCRDAKLYQKLFQSHNFGHEGPLNFQGVGINAKMNELQAGMGLAVLPYVEENIKKRKKVIEQYEGQLNFSKLKRLRLREGTEWNYSYYPVIFENEETLIKVQQTLNKKEIFPRRYFYPSLNTLKYVSYEEMPVSERIAETIMCLPLAHNMDRTETDLIIEEVNRILN